MRLVHAFIAGAAALMFATAAAAFERGPAIGTPAPVFSAPDKAGAPQTFESLKGERGLVLSFTRAADWCPYCQRQMIGLEGVREEIEARGWKLAVITTDTPAELTRFATRRNIQYALLSDEASAVIDQFALRDPAFPPGHRIHGVPVPSIFFIRADGMVAAKMGDDDYRVRPAPELVVSTLDNLNR